MTFEKIFSAARFMMETAGNAGAAAGTNGTAGPDGTVPAGACSGGSMLSMLIMYGAIGLIFYFMLYRPQKKRRQAEEALRKNIEVGDEIITIGGICGRVVSVKEDDVIVIETGADRTKLKMKSWSISSNESAKARQAEDAAKNAQEKKSGGLFGKKKDA